MPADVRTRVTMWLMRASASWRQWRGACPISSVAIEVSQHCNRRCSYCPVSLWPKPAGEIDEALFHEIVRQLADARFDGKIKYHFFNEPLLHGGLEGLVAHARSRLPRVRNVIYTNGDALTTQRARSLFAAGVDRFIVTDHGGRPRTNYVLAHGSGSRWSRSRVTVRTIGERTFLFNRGGLLALARTRRFSFCAYPAYEAVIDIHGNVLICCNDYHAAHVFGNIRAHPLLAIWESPAMRAARQELLRGVFSTAMCQHCVHGTLADELPQPIQFIRKPKYREESIDVARRAIEDSGTLRSPLR